MSRIPCVPPEGGGVTLGMFPWGCEDAVKRRKVLFRGGGGRALKVCHHPHASSRSIEPTLRVTIEYERSHAICCSADRAHALVCCYQSNYNTRGCFRNLCKPCRQQGEGHCYRTRGPLERVAECWCQQCFLPYKGTFVIKVTYETTNMN